MRKYDLVIYYDVYIFIYCSYLAFDFYVRQWVFIFMVLSYGIFSFSFFLFCVKRVSAGWYMRQQLIYGRKQTVVVNKGKEFSICVREFHPHGIGAVWSWWLMVCRIGCSRVRFSGVYPNYFVNRPLHVSSIGYSLIIELKSSYWKLTDSFKLL